MSSIVRFAGIVRAVIAKNIVRDTQAGTSTFTIGIALDAAGPLYTPVYGSPTSFGNTTDVVITNNVISSYPNAQGILVHDGQRISITGNTIYDALTGIQVGVYSAADTDEDITIQGNAITLTSDSITGSAGNNGIDITGTPSASYVKNVAIEGNTIRNANASIKNDYWGGIILSFANNVQVESNVMTACYGNGISLGGTVLRAQIRNNQIVDMQASSSGFRNGIYAGPGGSNYLVTGEIEGNRVDNASYGLRFDASSPGLIVSPNYITNSSFKVGNSVNVTIPTSYTQWSQ